MRLYQGDCLTEEHSMTISQSKKQNVENPTGQQQS